MLATSDFKKGKKIEIDGAPCEILECSHYKPGKGGAFMRTKYRNLLTGSVVEQNFRSGLKFPNRTWKSGKCSTCTTKATASHSWT